MEDITDGKDEQWFLHTSMDLFVKMKKHEITFDEMRLLAYLPSKSDKAGRSSRRKLIDSCVKNQHPSVMAEYLKWFVKTKMYAEKTYYTDTTNQDLLLWGLRVATNFSNSKAINTKFALDIVQPGEVLDPICSILTDEILINEMEDVAAYDELLKDTMNLVRILSNSSENRDDLRDANAVDLITSFIGSGDECLQLRSLLTLANIVDETEANYLESESKVIEILIHFCEIAINNDDHKYIWEKKGQKYHFYVIDMLTGLEKLASVDSNKNKIVEAGGIELLIKSLSEGSDREKISAAQIVWSLGFADGSRNSVKESSLPGILESLCEHDNSDVRKAIKGALWKLDDHIEKPVVKKSSSKDGHVMLSYSWSQQPLLQEISKVLWAQGYKIWMDIEQMSGSTLEAMAAAVEESKCVVICMSSNYKDSASCRTEAEYTFQLRKPFIPLMVEKGYKPDGWLGMMLGSKLYIDFSDAKQFSDSIEKLCVELGRVGICSSNQGQRMAIDTTVVTANNTGSEVDDWTADDIKNWCEENSLPCDLLNEKFGMLSGPILSQLQYMQIHSPTYLYSSLEKCGLEFNVVVRLTGALNKLGL